MHRLVLMAVKEALEQTENVVDQHRQGRHARAGGSRSGAAERGPCPDIG